MILTDYKDLKQKWKNSTCWEDSPLKELLENNGSKNLVSFNIYRKDIVDYYNRMINICIKNIQNEIKKYKEKINKIKKSKNKKELQENIGVSTFYMDSIDFDTIKYFLIHTYTTKIKHYEQELGTDSYNRSESQIF